MKICSSCGRQNPDDCTWCPECGTIPRSERIKRALITPFAISPIMKWCAVPGIVGMVVLAIGFVQKIRPCSHTSHISLHVDAREQKRSTPQYAGSRAQQIVRRIGASVPSCTVTRLASLSEFAMVTQSRLVEHGSGFHEARQVFRSFRSMMADSMERDLGDSYVWPNQALQRTRRLRLCFAISLVSAQARDAGSLSLGR